MQKKFYCGWSCDDGWDKEPCRLPRFEVIHLNKPTISTENVQWHFKAIVEAADENNAWLQIQKAFRWSHRSFIHELTADYQRNYDTFKHLAMYGGLGHVSPANTSCD